MLKLSRLVVFASRLRYSIPQKYFLSKIYLSSFAPYDDRVTNIETGETTFELESESSGENTDEEIIGNSEDGEFYDFGSNDENNDINLENKKESEKDFIKDAHKYFEEFSNVYMTQSQHDAIYDEALDPRYDFKDIDTENLSPKEIKQIKREKERKREIKREEIMKKIHKEKEMTISQYEEYIKLQKEGKVQSLEIIEDYVKKLNEYVEVRDDGGIEGKEALKNTTPKDIAKKVGLPEELFINPTDLDGLINDKNFEKKFEEMSIKRQLKEIRELKIKKKERLKSIWDPKKYYQGKFRRPINRKLMKEVSDKVIDAKYPIPPLPISDYTTTTNSMIGIVKEENKNNEVKNVDMNLNEINENNYEKYIEKNIISHNNNEDIIKNKKKRKKVLKRKLKKKEKEMELKKEEIEKHNKIQKLPKNIDEILSNNNISNINYEGYDTTIVIRDLLDPNIDILPHHANYQFSLSVSSYKLKLLRRIHFIMNSEDFNRVGLRFRNYPIHFTQILSNTTGTVMCLFWDYDEKDYEEVKNDENFMLYQNNLDKTIKNYINPDSIEMYLDSIHPLMISEDIKIQSCLELNKESIKDELIKHYHIMKNNFPILYFSKDYHNFSYNYLQFINSQVCAKLMNIKLGNEVDDVKRQKDYILKFKWFCRETDSENILDLLK